MQKFVSKYALAAHLSVLTVAPLILLQYCTAFQVATAMLWLSFVSLIWVFAAPSLLPSERIHASRMRVLYGVKRDFLVWFSLFIVVFATLRWVNANIEMIYNFDISDWILSEPVANFLPSGAIGSGYLEFSISVSLVVLLIGARHSMGRKARFFYVGFSSLLVAISAIAQLMIWMTGDVALIAKSTCEITNPSFVGTIYTVFAIASLFTIAIAIESGWDFAAFLSAASFVFIVPAAFVFSQPITIVVMCGAFVLSLLVVLSYEISNRRGSLIFKCFILFIVSFICAALLLMAIADDEFLLQKVSIFSDWQFISSETATRRGILSDTSCKIWLENIWLGSGIDTFKFELPFALSNEARDIISPKQVSPLNGWWLILTERGIIGTLIFAVVLLFLASSLFYRLFLAVKSSFSPDGDELKYSLSSMFFLPILVILFLSVCTFFEVSAWRIDVFLPICGFFVVGARSVRNSQLISVGG